MMSEQKLRIPYVDPQDVKDDEDMYNEFLRCAREGTPRPESQAVRAHVPATFWSFADTWKTCFHSGVCEHAIKELCRVYVSHSVKCEFCGNQRSEKVRQAGQLIEEDYKDLMNFEKSERHDERQKAALRYTEAIVWDLECSDHLWDELYKHFEIPEIVELGYFVAITMGQQRWLRTLNIEHHQILAGQAGSMAPGMEDMDHLKKAKASDEYWAKNKSAAPQTAE